MAIIYLLLILVILPYTNCANAIRCPSKCLCSWMMGSMDVDCSNRGLLDYPDFNNLPIESLDLSKNKFSYFPKHLADIPTLTYLDLSYNQISFIEADSFLGFTALRSLFLKNNTIQNWEDISASDAFLEANNLQHLSLSENNLSVFSANRDLAILNSTSLIILDLERCGITDVGGNVLQLGLPNLQKLKLSGNPLKSLKNLPSKNLVSLELNDCNIKSFDNEFLLPLTNLHFLNLSWNSGLEFSGKKDVVLPTIQKLDISYCYLHSVDLNSFPSLTYLNSRGNLLRNIGPTLFQNNIHLEVIDFSRNALAQISSTAFIDLKRLTKLDLSFNEIARIDRNLFAANDHLIYVNLSHNILGKFTPILSKSLRDINLSWNELVSIDRSVFSSLSSLQMLDLSNNLLKDFPGGMQAKQLQKLDLSNCRLTSLRNNTFSDFQQLTSLRLNGNRFTNPFPKDFFRSNTYLDEVWLGDNPWICNCRDLAFEEFYVFLTSTPAKLRDSYNVRCVSPTIFFGKMWSLACEGIWLPLGQSTRSSNALALIIYIIIGVLMLLVFFICFKKFLKYRMESRNEREYRDNLAEMLEIRRLNRRVLDGESAPNAPNSFDTALPTYEAALLMPKVERPVKSMLDLSNTRRSFWSRFRYETTEQPEEPELDLMLNRSHRSEEQLSNRDRERMAPMGAFRRTGRIEHNNSGTRRFSIEDDRFQSSNMKFQNMQSAEKIASFQSYENSPYTKRKPKIAEIPPFKRALVKAESVEFLTDPEFENAASKPGSPFARRKPKPTSPAHEKYLAKENTELFPAVEDYFGCDTKKHYSSSDGSDFQVIVQPEIGSSAGDLSAMSPDLDISKRKKRKHSNRRLSGNMSSVVATTGSSDDEPMVVVHRPLRETLF